MTSGPRRLGPEERALWHGVTRSIKPLKPHRDDEPAPAIVAKTARKTTSKAKIASVSAALAKPPPLPTLAPFGRRMRQRLARGTESIDGRLDLHGRTQAQAHAALRDFLRSAQARGAKNVLVITGKGARGIDGERGVLKRQVPLWLRLPEFRSYVVGFEDAHIGHGGEGALYVRIRKLKE